LYLGSCSAAERGMKKQLPGVKIAEI